MGRVRSRKINAQKCGNFNEDSASYKRMTDGILIRRSLFVFAFAPAVGFAVAVRLRLAA
jgi:hypothetical protein